MIKNSRARALACSVRHGGQWDSAAAAASAFNLAGFSRESIPKVCFFFLSLPLNELPYSRVKN